MKLSEESDVGVGQKSPRTTFVSDSDPLKMLTGVRNRVAMPTSAFRADMPSTKSNNRELYWEIKRYCRSVIQTLPGEHHTISMFYVVLVYIVRSLVRSFNRLLRSSEWAPLRNATPHVQLISYSMWQVSVHWPQRWSTCCEAPLRSGVSFVRWSASQSFGWRSSVMERCEQGSRTSFNQKKPRWWLWMSTTGSGWLSFVVVTMEDKWQTALPIYHNLSFSSVAMVIVSTPFQLLNISISGGELMLLLPSRCD